MWIRVKYLCATNDTGSRLRASFLPTRNDKRSTTVPMDCRSSDESRAASAALKFINGQHVGPRTSRAASAALKFAKKIYPEDTFLATDRVCFSSDIELIKLELQDLIRYEITADLTASSNDYDFAVKIAVKKGFTRVESGEFRIWFGKWGSHEESLCDKSLSSFCDEYNDICNEDTYYKILREAYDLYQEHVNLQNSLEA